jgi:hypothetical protein
MRRQRTYFILTLVISILVGIIFPLAMTTRPIDWKWFFYIMAMGFTLVWAVYSILLFGYVFLVEGRRNRNKLKTRKEEDPFALHSTKKWKDLGEITLKGSKDQEMSNANWN